MRESSIAVRGSLCRHSLARRAGTSEVQALALSGVQAPVHEGGDHWAFAISAALHRVHIPAYACLPLSAWCAVTSRSSQWCIAAFITRLPSPHYLTALYCIPISDVASRRHLCSARRHYLVVPRHSLSSYGRQVFAG